MSLTGQSVNQPTASRISRRWRLRELPQEQSEEGPDDVYGGAAAGTTGKLPTGLEPRWPGPGTHCPDHGTEQAGHPGVVPELQGSAEEASPHREDEVSE
jgi:hypothetical protein